MDKKTKEKVFFLLEEIMKASLVYCKDENQEIRDYSIKVNDRAHDLKILIERHFNHRSCN